MRNVLNKKYLFICILVSGFMVLCQAGDAGRGGYAGAFLRMGLGARILGMGGGSVALSNEYSSYYNPAGLVFLKGKYFSSTINSMSLDRNFFCLLYAQSFENMDEENIRAGFSAGVISAGVSNIDGRDFNGIHTQNYSTSENCFFFSFALMPVPFLSLGVSGKVLYYRLPGVAREGGNLSSTGFGLDFGMMVKVRDNLSLGISIKDIRAKYSWDTQKVYEKGTQTIDEFPVIFRAGAAYDSLFNRITVTFDIEKAEFFPASFYAGFEMQVVKCLTLRSGLLNGHITFGFGTELSVWNRKMYFNYGYVSEPAAPDNMNIFTWSLCLGEIK
ncbi:MAG: DUF5723 family protein [bacterium]